MATLNQFRNRVKTIVVAKVSNEFKRAAIVKRILENAKDKGHVSTGKLTNPSGSRSITPFSDDRWLIRKDAVRISVVELPSRQYMVSNIRVTVRYGLNYRYQQLASYTAKNIWTPPREDIAQWIKNKINQGKTFEYGGKRLIATDETKIKKLSYIIARSIGEKGIKKTSFANPFINKRNGVEPTLNRGIAKAMERIDFLYATSVDRAVTNIINGNL